MLHFYLYFILISKKHVPIYCNDSVCNMQKCTFEIIYNGIHCSRVLCLLQLITFHSDMNELGQLCCKHRTAILIKENFSLILIVLSLPPRIFVEYPAFVAWTALMYYHFLELLAYSLSDYYRIWCSELRKNIKVQREIQNCINAIRS